MESRELLDDQEIRDYHKVNTFSKISCYNLLVTVLIFFFHFISIWSRWRLGWFAVLTPVLFMLSILSGFGFCVKSIYNKEAPTLYFKLSIVGNGILFILFIGFWS